MLFWYTLTFVLLAFASRVTWLFYCGWVTNKQPKHAAAIIAATGRHYPFKRGRGAGRAASGPPLPS